MIIVFVIVGSTERAWAVLAFARKYKTSCLTCQAIFHPDKNSSAGAAGLEAAPAGIASNVNLEVESTQLQLWTAF